MKTIKTIKTGLLIILALSVFGCNNYFHDLMPPDGNRILSFSVDGQIGNAVIGDDSVNAIISIEADITSIIPNIQVSPKATLFPLTLDYLEITFPGIDVYEAAVELHKSEDLKAYVEDLIKKHPDFKIPVMDKAIDFSGPVNFIVMSGQGNIRQYKIIINIDSGLPHLFSFGFYKYDNPELIHDAVTAINESAQTIQSEILYPAEMNYLSYQLIPVYEILGDRIEVDNIEIKSGIDAIQFTQGVGTKTKKITIWRDGMSAEFILTAVFSEDPDSIRSITDFRFNKTDNAGISANAVASIIKNDALGTINVQVFYSGAKPAFLTPRFVSPGTVTVGGLTQISGSNIQDFSSPVEYYVVSRNNKFTRTYTVYVDFVDIASSSPVINGFKFSSIINTELTEDSQAVISDASGQIMAAVKYRGSNAPETLAAEFSATGIVTVNNAVQTSGFSAQNFSRQVKYTVTHPENPLLKRDYWVQVSFTRDTSSDAAITSFSFHPDENAGLNEALTGKIDNKAGKITIFAPIGSGVSARTMYPRFSAAEQVSVNGVPQSSGTSGQVFNAPVIYKVVSANGINSREYFVTVRELRSTIYVNLNASGEGDGSSWSDAFRHLEDACNAAAEFDDDIPKEIWIAKGIYKPSPTGDSSEYFLLTPNTSYLGGFAGWETSKSERNAAVNPVVISGDMGGGVYSQQLFGNFNGTIVKEINGDIIFENLEFTRARANGSGGRDSGAAINVAQWGGSDLRITNCTFNDLQSSGTGGAVYNQGSGNIEIKNVTISSIAAGGALHFNGTGNAEITNVTITSVSNGGALYNEGNALLIKDSEIKNVTGTYGIYSSGGLDADNLNLHNITGQGINISGGALNLSDVNIDNISGRSVYFDSTANRAVIKNSILNDCGDVYLAGSSSATITDTKVTNVKSGITNGLYVKANTSGSISLENLTIDTVPGGGGMLLENAGLVYISGSSVTNTNGAGIRLIDTGNTEIHETVVNTTGGVGAIYNTGNNLKIVNTDILNAIASYGVYSSGGLDADNLKLQNITGQGIYILGGALNLSNINIINISGRSVYFDSIANRAVIKDSNFNNCGGVYFENSSSVVVDDMKIIDVYNERLNYDDEDYYISYGLFARSTLSGNIHINNVRMENVQQGTGISVSTAHEIIISNCNIKNVSNVGIGLAGNVSNVEIYNVTIDTTGTNGITNNSNVNNLSVVNSRIISVKGTGIYNTGNNLKITDTSIDSGIYSSRDILIDRVTVKGSINLNTTGLSKIHNTEVSNGNIQLNGTGNVDIYGATLKDSSKINANCGTLSISNSNIINVDWGAALQIGPNITHYTITNSKFENCKYGAIGCYGTSIGYGNPEFLITGTDFINCTGTDRQEAFDLIGEGMFYNCRFIHNSALYQHNKSTSVSDTIHVYFYLRSSDPIVFNDCTFTNLKSTATPDNAYIFTNRPSGGYWPGPVDLTLRNCNFTFSSGVRMGMLSFYSINDSYNTVINLLLDGVNIVNNGSAIPLIRLNNNSGAKGTFRFKANNIYNGTLLDTVAKISGLGSGVIQLEQGTVPTLVP